MQHAGLVCCLCCSVEVSPDIACSLPRRRKSPSIVRSSNEQFRTEEPPGLVRHKQLNISCPELISHPTMRQDMDASQLKTKIQEMKMRIKILELQAELEMKTKILELKAELVAKHVKLEAEIRKAEKVAHWYDQQEGQSQCSSTSHHSASPKSVTSTSRLESAGSKAVKDGKYGVFGTLIAKLSRSAPHTRSSDSTSSSPGLPGWLTGKSWKAREKNRCI